MFIEPNGLRELHWHTVDGLLCFTSLAHCVDKDALEWLYIIHGKGRATAFAGGSTARTFDFQVGDTGVFPISYGHYVCLSIDYYICSYTHSYHVDQEFITNRAVDISGNIQIGQIRRFQCDSVVCFIWA